MTNELTVQVVSEVPASDAEKKITERSAGQESGLSKKAQLSAYFTIAAAAFGLISDGCKSSLILTRPHTVLVPRNRERLDSIAECLTTQTKTIS